MLFCASNSCKALRIVASRLDSCAPSAPRDLSPYCFRRRLPASFTSNSASLRLPAPKSTARNDFVFNISTQQFTAQTSHWPSEVTLNCITLVIPKQRNGQWEKKEV